MILIKTPKEIETLREGGRRLAQILREVASHVKPGISAYELNEIAEELIKKGGDLPAFKGYTPEGHRKPYPAALCVSVNSEVVHGVPKKSTILKDGDIVSLDLGLKHKGLFTDHAVTVPVGKINKKDSELLRATEEALMVGINAITVGGKTGDVGFAIEQFIKPYKYGIVRVLSGHGVGKEIHEDPFIPNFGKKGKGELFRAGMVVAIEPMFTRGGDEVVGDSDGYTIKTADGSRAAHFEHTVAITEDGIEILTL